MTERREIVMKKSHNSECKQDLTGPFATILRGSYDIRDTSVMLILFLFICRICSPAAAGDFTDISDYQQWTVNVGYPQGLLVPVGMDGINQDHFHSLPGSAGYSSGKIVIGDSRCCQLGIYQNRMGFDEYAVFAVWGGHYISGTGTSILTDEYLSEIEQCFQEQIRTSGECTVFFFATVNDYDYMYNTNAAYISTAVTSAERIASMTYTWQGIEYWPDVIMIGFEGGDQNYFSFNAYVYPYNVGLSMAVSNSAVLGRNASQFITVPDITGRRTTFISDGLHYSDATLRMIADYMKNFR